MQVLRLVRTEHPQSAAAHKRLLLNDGAALLRTLESLRARSAKLLECVAAGSGNQPNDSALRTHCLEANARAALLGRTLLVHSSNTAEMGADNGTDLVEGQVPSLMTSAAHLAQPAASPAGQDTHDQLTEPPDGLDTLEPQPGSLRQWPQLLHEPQLPPADQHAHTANFAAPAEVLEALLFSNRTPASARVSSLASLEPGSVPHLRRTFSTATQKAQQSLDPVLAALPFAAMGAVRLKHQLYAREASAVHESACAGAGLCAQLVQRLRCGAAAPEETLDALYRLAAANTPGAAELGLGAGEFVGQECSDSGTRLHRAVTPGLLTLWTRRLDAQINQLERMEGTRSTISLDVALVQCPEALLAAQERQFATRTAAPLWQVTTNARMSTEERVLDTCVGECVLVARPVAMGASLTCDMRPCETCAHPAHVFDVVSLSAIFTQGLT